jgi:hypothetical protein
MGTGSTRVGHLPLQGRGCRHRVSPKFWQFSIILHGVVFKRQWREQSLQGEPQLSYHLWNKILSRLVNEIVLSRERTKFSHRKGLLDWYDLEATSYICVTCISSQLHILYTSPSINSVAWVRERTLPTEKLPVVGEVNANFYEKRVPSGQRDGYLQPFSRLSRPEPTLFRSRSSSVVLTRLSGPRSRPTMSQKIW